MSQPNNHNPGSGKRLDDLFRDAIGNQEVTPSQGVWKSLNWKLLIRELIHFNFMNVPRLALISATGGLVVVASLTFWAIRPDDNRSKAPNKELPEHSAVKSTILQPAEKTSAVNQNSLIAASPSSLKTNSPVISSPSHTQHRNPQLPSAEVVTLVPAVSQNPRAGNLLASDTKVEPAVRYPETPSLPVENTEITLANESSLQIIEPINSLEFNGFNIPGTADTLTFIRSGEVYKYVRDKVPVPSFFSANLGVAPELSVYKSNGSSTIQGNYWLNAGIAYHFSRFSVRTGLGIGYTYDEGSYTAEYRSNDSVSYYRRVIGYIQDPSNPGHIIYIIRNQAIYDSVNHIADDRTRDRYTYLQVPLLVGYSLYETSRFRLGFEIGPAVSFLIGSKQADPVVDFPNGRLIKLQDNSPSRLSTNWQLWVNLNIEYQFTRNWALSINPYYKYFITAPAKTSENGTRNAQSVGLDVGIQYFFGRKGNKK